METKMKRGFSTLSCLQAPLDEVLTLAKGAGMQGVEIRMDKSMTLCGVPEEQADTVRAAFEKAGIVITDLACSVTVKKDDPEQLELGCRTVDLAEKVGAGAIRIFFGSGTPRFSQPAQHDEASMIRVLRELCAYAAERGVEIWAETHSEYSACAEMRRMVDAVGADNLKIIWDVLHSIEYRESLADSVTALRGKIAHVHLKDARFSGNADSTQYIHTKLGEGEMPYAEILRALRSLQFDGFLSLEWEAPWRRELDGSYPDTATLFSEYNRILDAAENAE